MSDMLLKLTPSEAAYNPYGAAEGVGCATCRWFMPGESACHLVAGPIVATGKSELYRPATPELLALEAAADLADVEAEYAEKEAKAGLEGGNPNYRAVLPETEPPLFATPSGFKSLSDDLWIAWYTNAYEDHEGEYFPLEELDKDVAYMKATGEYPVLQRWHMGGLTNHGQAVHVDTIGRFAVAIGEYFHDPLSQAFKAYYAANPEQALSHGFRYDPAKKDGAAYRDFHTFEISTLPPGAAANPYTVFVGEGVKEMNVPEEKIRDLAAILGEEAAKQLITDGQKATAALDAAGVAYKAEMPPAPEAATEDEDEAFDMKACMKKMQADLETLGKAMQSLMESGKPAAAENEKAALPKAEQHPNAPDARAMAAVAEMLSNQQKQIQDRQYQDDPTAFIVQQIFGGKERK